MSTLRTCRECRRGKIAPTYHPERVEKWYDGEKWSLFISKMPLFKCTTCGYTPSGYTYDRNEAIRLAIFREAGLLMPDEIYEIVIPYCHGYRQLARHLTIFGGVPVDHELLSDWVAGIRIPSRAMDAILRRFRLHPTGPKKPFPTPRVKRMTHAEARILKSRHALLRLTRLRPRTRRNL